MDKEKYEKEIQLKLKQAKELIAEAENIADNNELDFYFAVEYGMGGTYYGYKQESSKEYEERFHKGWNPSSHGC